MTDVFISAETHSDFALAAWVKEKLESTYLFKAHLIVNDNHPNAELVSLIKRTITKSKYFIPLLSEVSINNQWVNQEIGYAVAANKKICPIVQKEIIMDLRGFLTLTQKFDHTFSFERILPDMINDRKQIIGEKNSKLFHDMLDTFTKYLIELDSPIYIQEHEELELPGAKIFLFGKRAVMIYKGKWHWISEHRVTERLIGIHGVPFDKNHKLDEKNYPKGKEIHFERPIPHPPVKDPFES
jgi:TIR domain